MISKRRMFRSWKFMSAKYPGVRTILEDCLLPFFVGVFFILFIFWARTKFSGDNPEAIATFQNKHGQTFLRRNHHGVDKEQEKEGAFSNSKYDNFDLSIVAPASSGFKQRYITTRPRIFGNGPVSNENLNSEPPGTIWSWPRLERESTNSTLVWVVTPTYRNPYQYAELTRVAQALYPARKFVRWIVVDDLRKSVGHPLHLIKLKTFLEQFAVKYKVLKSKLRSGGQKEIFKPKGVDARRTAIAYIRKMKLQGVVYFADDDNTYDSDIFRQMQSTKTVSVWPTGAITQWTISSPVVNKYGVVSDFFDAWTSNRKFPLDFASFAIHTDLLHNNPKANVPWIQGYEETVLLRTLNVNKEKFLPLAANGTEVLTWHTKTLKDYQLRSKANLLRIMKERVHYPQMVQKLLEKYDFVFEPVEKSTVKELHINEGDEERKGDGDVDTNSKKSKENLVVEGDDEINRILETKKKLEEITTEPISEEQKESQNKKNQIENEVEPLKRLEVISKKSGDVDAKKMKIEKVQIAEEAKVTTKNNPEFIPKSSKTMNPNEKGKPKTLSVPVVAPEVKEKRIPNIAMDGETQASKIHPRVAKKFGHETLHERKGSKHDDKGETSRTSHSRKRGGHNDVELEES